MKAKITGNTEKEIDTSIEKAIRREVVRHFGKPLEECSKEELNEQWGEGLDVGCDDWEMARYIAKVGLRLGVPMADPTIEISEPFEPDEGNVEMRLEQTRLNLYLLRNGERIARRGDPDTPQAGLWVPMVNGYFIRDIDEGTIEVWFDGKREKGRRH